MTALRRFLNRLLAFFRSGKAEADLSREIDSHLQLIEDEYVTNGMNRDDARYAARRAFGGVEQVKEHQRAARGFRWLDDSRIDFKLGARMLVKYPGLSIIGGAGLAVAIAISASFFAFLYAFMYSTLPLDDGDRIVALENWDIEKNNEERRALHDLIEWRSAMRSVTEISAFKTIGRNLIIPGGSVEFVRIGEMTASGFRLARVAPLLGRPLLDADEAPGAPPVAIIGYRVWQSRFHGDPSIIGRDIRFGNLVHSIVGVMPESFAFPVNHEYWTALRTDVSRLNRLQGPAIFIFGRLRDGVSLEEAQAELATIGSRSAAAFPETHAKLQPNVMPYVQPILDIQGMTSWQFSVIQATVSVLLLIVAVNVSILIYARTATRLGEIAVRSALGASRGRIVTQLFIEALVLAGVAAVIGIMLAQFGMSQAYAIMQTEGMGIPYWIDGSIPGVTMLYVIALAVLAAAIFGVLPALHATGRRMQSTLKQAGASDALRLGRTWTALIVAQVALAVAGLPMALASAWGEARVEMTQEAFDKQVFLSATIAPEVGAPAEIPQQEYLRQLGARFAKLQADLLAKVKAEPLVAEVTMADETPGHEPGARIDIEDWAVPAVNVPAVRVNRVAIDFFDVLGAQIVAGRGLVSSDASGSPAVVVNRAFVRQILGGANAIGRRFTYAGPTERDGANVTAGVRCEIVGVVSDLFTNSADPDLVRPVIYHVHQPGARSADLLIHVRGPEPAQFTPRLRDLLAGLDPSARLQARSFSEAERQQVIAFRLVVVAMSLIVISVLMLSAAGIYALMSFTVSQRRKEIGIRAAMGADGRQLLFSIFKKAAAQLGAGVIVGVAIAMLADVTSAGEMLGAFGRGLLPIMSLVMVIVGLIAAIGPARRGLRVQPTEALRSE
jgi:putative ABC transport system permease protein